MYLGLSLVVWGVWDQFIFRQFLGPGYISQDLQAPSYVVGTNYRVLIYCTCHFQGGSLCFNFFCLLVSSVSALTQGGGGGHFFRLTCSVALWGGRDTQTNNTGVCSQCLSHMGPAPTHGACALPAHTAQALGCSTGNCSRPALGCMHLPGLSCAGSGTRVVLRGADSVGPVFCALPRSQQLK